MSTAPTTHDTDSDSDFDRTADRRQDRGGVARLVWFVTIRIVLIAAASLGATLLILAALHSSASGHDSRRHGDGHHHARQDTGRLGAAAVDDLTVVHAASIKLAAGTTALPRAAAGGRPHAAPAKPPCPGPAAYWDPNGTPGTGGQPGVAVALGPIGVAVGGTPTAGQGCGPHASKKNNGKCGCLVPAPSGWAPMPPPPAGNRSGYSLPGYLPNGYTPSGYIPNGYGPAGSPNPYPYPNSYPTRNYPSGYAPAPGYPSGFYPPSTGYAPAPGNPCANPSGYGPAGYPVIDSNGRLFCPVSPTNTTPGVGVNITGW